MVNLILNLSKILVDILVSSFESLLGEFSNLSGHHALLILEEAIGATKEAVKGDDFLEESELGVVLRSLLRFNGLLNGGVNLAVDLLLGEGRDSGIELSSFFGSGKG